MNVLRKAKYVRWMAKRVFPVEFHARKGFLYVLPSKAAKRDGEDKSTTIETQQR